MLVLRASRNLRNRIAVVELFGSIGGQIKSPAYEQIFATIAKDDNIRALVLDIDSPGGGVSASDYLYRSVLKVAEKKPVIASIRGLGASGAYYISCAAHKIVASHAAIVGSIGVISVRPALQELMERMGVGVNVNKSGLHKDMGAFWRDATPEEEEKMQALIDDSFNSFVRIVSEFAQDGRRGCAPVSQREKFTGRPGRRNSAWLTSWAISTERSTSPPRLRAHHASRCISALAAACASCS